jgi:hypothetical protein
LNQTKTTKNKQKICQDLQDSYLDLPKLKLVYGQKDDSNKLTPWFVTGFTIAEGCFGVSNYTNTKSKTT